MTFLSNLAELTRQGESQKVAYAYTAGNEVSMMTLSLRNIYCDEWTCELLKIEGVPGTFVANTIDYKAFDSESYRGGYDGVATKITFDGGATWAPIPAPTTYADVSCRMCAPGTKDCNLHLHVEGMWHSGQSAIPPLYSHENAPGVIMAVGNTGKHFVSSLAGMCTYLSRDGGHNWEQVLSGPNIYEIGDHGGLIVAAKHQSAGVTDEFVFSVDEGKCWQGPVKMDQAMNVDNIRVEKDSASHIFSLQGTECIKTNNTAGDPALAKCQGKDMSEAQGLLVNVDFMKLLQNFRVCDDSELEEVSFTPGECQLGGHYTFERRKLDDVCFNGKEYKHACPFKKTCDCVRADYECEFGYHLNAKTGNCEKVKREATCYLIEDGDYFASVTGLREIRSDTCTRTPAPKHKKGKNWHPILPQDTDGNGHELNTSTSSSGMSAVAGFFVFLVVMGVICAAGGFVWTKVLDDAKKRQVVDACTAVYDKVASVVQGATGGKTSSGGFSDMRGGFEPLAEAEVNVD